MRMIKHAMAGAALAMVIASPVLASEPVRPAATVAAGKSLTLRKGARASAKTDGGNSLAQTAIILLVLAGAAGVAGGFAAADDGSSN